MKFFVSVTTLFYAGLAIAQGTFTINTPTNVVQCQPLLITWAGGQASYRHISVRNGDDPSAAALREFGEQAAGATSFSWARVDIQANTRIGFDLRDSTGQLAQTASIPVLSSSDTSCLNGGGASSGTDSSATGTTTGASTTPSTPAGTTTPASTPSTPVTAPSSTVTTPVSRSSSSTSGTAAPASTTSSDNAAPTKAISLGAAGIAGAAVLAMLA
ncbi:hypothetical protein ONZ45_g8968 [Pleurotus djamor]|nr:hypothetical protein ONZ45_g8968 [Pleurotus djamor]